MGKLSGQDTAAIKDSITHSGEFRVHLIYSRSGGRVQCRMWHHDGHVVGSANGYGYDKGGTALGQAIELFFAEELKGLKPGSISGPDGYERQEGGLYGLAFTPRGPVLDGACGKECMLAILKALGFTDCNLYETGKLSSMVVARKPARG